MMRMMMMMMMMMIMIDNYIIMLFINFSDFIKLYTCKYCIHRILFSHAVV